MALYCLRLPHPCGGVQPDVVLQEEVVHVHHVKVVSVPGDLLQLVALLLNDGRQGDRLGPQLRTCRQEIPATSWAVGA
jgi:hypothetical protein